MKVPKHAMKMTGRLPVWIAILSATVLAAAAGGYHLILRFDHNAQGEMYNLDGGIDYFYSVELFLLAFVPVWVVVFLSIWVISRVAQKLISLL